MPALSLPSAMQMTRRDRMARETAHRRRQIERRQLKNKESEEKRLLHERKAVRVGGN